MGFVIVIFAAIFVAPFVLGAFIIVQDADRASLTRWFGFITVVFVVILVVGAQYLLSAAAR
ncbi:MAG TPA: hypothetical protein VFC51_19870 [Chloroflexota bacterium]|nr:hypothetical protein [Chloroflexota bacterium]